jgi:hypothetical protein
MLPRLAQVYSNVGALEIVASRNCQLFARSGPRKPLQGSPLGVLREGVWADLLPQPNLPPISVAPATAVSWAAPW